MYRELSEADSEHFEIYYLYETVSINGLHFFANSF